MQRGVRELSNTLVLKWTGEARALGKKTCKRAGDWADYSQNTDMNEIKSFRLYSRNKNTGQVPYVFVVREKEGDS